MQALRPDCKNRCCSVPRAWAVTAMMGMPSRLPAHPSGEGKSVFIAELDVEQDGVGLLVLEQALRATQIFRTESYIILRFEPITKQLSIDGIVFDTEDARHHTFSAGPKETTRLSSLMSASCHGGCLSSRDSALARRNLCSSRVKSLLVRMKTGRSAVRGLARHSPRSSASSGQHQIEDYELRFVRGDLSACATHWVMKGSREEITQQAD